MEKTIQFQRPNLVGVIHTPEGFEVASAPWLDVVEIRVDALANPPSPAQISNLPVPAIITVRHQDEGGAQAMTEEQRLARYLSLLPPAAAVDLEIRSATAMGDLITTVQRNRKTLILSFHDFDSTPPLSELGEICETARGLGADIVKIAAKTETAGEVARLLMLLEEYRGPLAVMGMGTLGRASRMLFAKAGSALNYGWLDKPQVAGQWSATEFAELLARA
ncbi:MAG TPA: type I 3-dehydroquinate dehydratase [Terrimicrobiaceae bacterium]